MDKNRDIVFYIKILKQDAQKLMNLIKTKFSKKKVFNDRYKIMEEKNHVLFPLKIPKNQIELFTNLIKNFLDFEIIKKKVRKKEDYKSKNLEEALKGRIPKKDYDLIPKSYDIIGDIAVIEFDNYQNIKNIKDIKIEISRAIIEVNKNVKTVYEKIGKISGDHRIRKLKFLGGIRKTETIHKENGCMFKLDIKKTFFTPRLINERRTISTLDIKNNEIIIDLFAGVGPFSIQIAKLNNVKIYAFDKNPYAFKYLKQNIKMNKIKGEIIPVNIDVKDLKKPGSKHGKDLKNKAFRIIMNLPERSLEFLDIVCYLIKEKGGIIHNYQFCERPNSINKAEKKLKEKLKEFNYDVVEIKRKKIVKSFSPTSEMIAIDACVKKLNKI